MGSALLERLRLAGVQPTVYDIDPKALETAQSAGAIVTTSAAAVARASTIIDVVVRTDQEVLDCVTGKNGVLEGAEKDTLVLLHSTILPQTTRKVAEAACQQGVDVIDAAMTSVPRIVREGNLTFLVGGPTDLVGRARPHLLRMSKEVLHLGPLGAGNIAKLIKNLVTGSETLIVHEAIRIGEAGGIPYRDALEMMRKVYSGTVLNRWQERFDPSGADPTPRAGLNVYNKDIPLAAELGRELGLDIPITEQLAAAGKRLAKEKAPS
jgi:3-hydroxyisobutyrate dehydrogenase